MIHQGKVTEIDNRLMMIVIKLTACSSGEHGDRFKDHLVEQQGHRLVVQVVPQEVAVVVHISPLARDGNSLKKQILGKMMLIRTQYVPEGDI